MSRYVSVQIEVTERELLLEWLRSKHIDVAVAPVGERLMLDGSLECAGEPVEMRIAPGVMGAVEDFGFVRDGVGYRLVCGEYDRRRLERELLADLTQVVAQARLEAHAQREGLTLERHVEADGTRRLVLRRK